MIYTGYYARLKDYEKAGLTPIAISGGVPDFFFRRNINGGNSLHQVGIYFQNGKQERLITSVIWADTFLRF